MLPEVWKSEARETGLACQQSFFPRFSCLGVHPSQEHVLANQVKSLDWRVRKAKLICSLPRRTVTELLQKLGTLLSG